MFNPDTRTVPNGTVWTVGIRYNWASRQPGDDPDATRGRTNPRVFAYVMFKAGGLWYVTGTGKVPVAAGWGAVMRWLGKDGREVVWVKAANGWEDVYPVQEEGLLNLVPR